MYRKLPTGSCSPKVTMQAYLALLLHCPGVGLGMTFGDNHSGQDGKPWKLRVMPSSYSLGSRTCSFLFNILYFKQLLLVLASIH